jgi:putative ABC transport system permease protein
VNDFSLLLRWSWRDLRANWAKVAAIALVIAIGTGGYAGLTSQANWRRASYDASYEHLAMHDVRVKLATGSAIEQGTLVATAMAIEHAGAIEAAEERLIVATQVDASNGDETVLVRGEITGTSLADGGPVVNRFHAVAGRVLGPDDSGAAVVMLERHFGTHYDLADAGTITIAGDRPLEYVGQVLTPEYFAVAPEGDILMSEASFAALFTSLETAQSLAGMPGQVNDLVLTLDDGADRGLVVAELESAMDRLPVGVTVLTRDDNLAYSTLTSDVENDQRMFNLLAGLLFIGAVGAAFNLIHRLAEQQRREFGIQMALGVSPWRIALRPLLVSAQIALLGVVFGVLVGVWIGSAMQGVMEEFVPLPMWQTDFQWGVFAGVAIIGFLIPFVATAVPVWRAVRVRPVAAIRPLHLSAKPPKTRSRVTRHLPGSTFAVLPFRNLRRNLRRTTLTVIGIGAIVMVLVAFLGIVDSLMASFDRAADEARGDEPNRIVVGLDSFYPADSTQVRAIRDAASVDAVEATLRLGGTVTSETNSFDILIDLVDTHDGLWTPTITAGSTDTVAGLLLAEEAARDLAVDVGDLIVLRHPQRTGPLAVELVETELPVLGLHPNPIRSFAYLDIGHASLMGLDGIVNQLQLTPAGAATTGDVQRELFTLDAVTSVQSATAATDAMEEQMGALVGIIGVMAIGVLVLALLIAFNTASINLDARSRDYATMFAYGIKVRTALRIAMTESLVIGIAASVVGLVGGVGMLYYMTGELIASTLPEFGMEVTLNGTTFIAIVLLGVVAVSLAPLLTARRMRRMDIPGTLRLME